MTPGQARIEAGFAAWWDRLGREWADYLQARAGAPHEAARLRALAAQAYLAGGVDALARAGKPVEVNTHTQEA